VRDQPAKSGEPQSRKRQNGREPNQPRVGGGGEDTPNRVPALWLAFFVVLILGCLSFLPRVSGDPHLAESFWEATGALLVFFLILRHRVARAGRTLSYDIVLRNVHYVQLIMQTCVYAYWGWYWREVYRFAPLIVAQIIFAYALDMLVCWWRRDKWVLGFGPFPIILSTNLFLWFRDEWFFLQFLMVATGVLGKEFIKWRREGRLTHIFNPSALSLFVFSVALIATKTTTVSWGIEIATSLHRPPHIYLEIFLLGLVVQALFSVTLVTLSSAAVLCALNLAYTHHTGVYHFVDSNIPVSVFLGLHLLVTDPATSPRTKLGKILFGGLYGAGVFTAYGALGWFGAPEFYDKLLCVPALNLSVRALDRASEAVAARLRSLAPVWTWSPRQANFASMAVWVSLFAAMMGTGFLNKGKDFPGGNPEFWHQACVATRWNACKTWVRVLNDTCQDGSGTGCFTLAKLLNEGLVTPRDAVLAGVSFGRACDLGVPEACASLITFTQADGKDAFQRACEGGDGASCFILGSLYSSGLGVPQDGVRAFSLFERSCASKWWRGCGRLGTSYLVGQGTAADPEKAAENFEKGCRGGNAPSCVESAKLYHRGIGVFKDDELALERLQQACNLGLRPACQQLGGLAASRSVLESSGFSR
jgi:Sel1 repeat